MLIFSGSSNQELAKETATKLNTQLSPLDIHVFPDLEKRVRVVDSVVDKDCVVVQSTSIPADSNYMELFFILDALKRSSARSIIAIIPYLGYGRQDHVFRSGEAVSLEVIAHLLENRGVEKLIVFDLHSIKIPEQFHIPVVHLSALPLFAEEIKKRGWNSSDTVLVSPDMGGGRRIKILSELLGNQAYASIEKNRDLSSGRVSADIIYGSLAKRAIIVDDMISSGGTIATATKLLLKNGVEEVFVFATHPVFSENAAEVLDKCDAKKIYVTNTIYVPKEKKFSKLEVLSVAELIANELYEDTKSHSTTN